MNYPIGAFGIELETENIPSGTGINLQNFHTTHDASIESMKESFIGKRITNNSGYKFNFRSSRFGTELVSIVFNGEKSYGRILKELTSRLYDLGEPPKSYLAGFHVHVNCPFNLAILKNIICLGKHLEQVFYLMGCMGYDYRGKRNDSIFCRPITQFGPVCVKVSPRFFAQVMNVDDLLATSTTEHFKLLYGDLDQQIGMCGKYVPVRYSWLNLVPLWNQGSLEFRPFNKSLEANLLQATIEFCRHFVKVLLNNNWKDAEPNSIFEFQSRERVINTFIDFCKRTDFNTGYTEILLEAMSSSDTDSIIIPKNFIFSHLMFHRERGDTTRIHWESSSEYSPKRVKRDLIIQPNLSTNRVVQQISNNSEREVYEEESNNNYPEPEGIIERNSEDNQIDASEFFRARSIFGEQIRRIPAHLIPE